MPRRDDALTPEMERELDALDLTLAGEGSDRELAEIVRTVRGERAAPGEHFARELDAWAADGFGRRRGAEAEHGATAGAAVPSRAARLLNRLPRFSLLPALAVAASLLVALVVAGSALQGADEGRPASSAAPAPATQDQGPAADDAAAPRREASPDELSSSAAAPAPTEPLSPGVDEPMSDQGLDRRTRRVERAASLVLGAPVDDIDDVADGVIRATDQARGVVLTSNVSSDADGSGGASFELRIPSDRLGPTLASLSKLADVKSRNQSSTDITSAFISPRERLTDGLTERKSLLRQLAKADTPNETASIRARLRTASSQIASARARLSTLRERTSFSRVTVSVEATDEGGGSGGSTVGDALDDALRILAVSLGVALVALAILLPIALVLAGLHGGTRALRRRRRESVLDAG